MKNILFFIIFFISVIAPQAQAYTSKCSVYTYGHGSPDDLSNFLQDLKQFVKNYKCFNKQTLDNNETEAVAACIECNSFSPTHFFIQMKSWIVEQQEENLQPCEGKHSFESLKEHMPNILTFPLQVISTSGSFTRIQSIEEFYHSLPSVFNAHVLQVIQEQNFEDMSCSNTGASIGQNKIWIKKDKDQQLKIFMINTPHQ